MTIPLRYQTLARHSPVRVKSPKLISVNTNSFY